MQLTEILEKYSLEYNGEQKLEIPNTDRETLVELFADLGSDVVGVEVGVERGLYSETILSKKKKGTLKLFCVDPWLAYQGYREHVSQDKLDGFVIETNNRLAAACHRTQNKYQLIRKTSIEAAQDFADESLDFVYIDGNHEYSHVVADICAWYPKVKKGGILAGHDYIRRRRPELGMHVIEALDGFMQSYQLKPYFVLGRKDRVQGEKRDNTRSWMYIKE